MSEIVLENNWMNELGAILENQLLGQYAILQMNVLNDRAMAEINPNTIKDDSENTEEENQRYEYTHERSLDT